MEKFFDARMIHDIVSISRYLAEVLVPEKPRLYRKILTSFLHILKGHILLSYVVDCCREIFQMRQEKSHGEVSRFNSHTTHDIEEHSV